MVIAAPSLTRQSGFSLVRAIVRLAGWRFLQMWRFLCIIWLCMLAMVVLACAPPLFSRVAISANIRATAAQSSAGQTLLMAVTSLAPTPAQLVQAQHQLDLLLHQGTLSSYLHSAPQLVLQTPPLLPSSTSNAAPLVLDGYDTSQMAQHLTLLQGHLPQTTNDGTLEIVLTQTQEHNLALHVGSHFADHIAGLASTQAWDLLVVGIVAPRSLHDAYWLESANPFGSLYTTQRGPAAYNILTAREPLRVKLAALQTLPGKDASHLFWSYPFDLSHLDAGTLPDLSQQMSTLDFQVPTTLEGIPGVTFAQPMGTLFTTLSTYEQQIAVLELIIGCLLALILALILFLLGMMANVLVERQVTLIATLRSRGATHLHILGAFATQGVVLSVLALLPGPFLALLLVDGLGSLLLAPTDRSALTVLSTQPLTVVLDIKWFALIAVLLALSVMLATLRKAAKLDLVTLRRETTRSKGVPFWRRYHLDLFVILVIIGGYIGYSFFWRAFITAQSDDPLVYNAANIVGFVAPPLVVSALLMLFLRLLPRLLGMITALATRKRSAPAVLAFVQARRSPRAMARIIILLALAISSSCFLLTLIHTKQARAADAASFAVGADFSGSLPTPAGSASLTALQEQYSHLPGVQSATLGYSDDIDNALGDIRIFAVDTRTYSQTAFWPANNAAQGLPELDAQLAAHRNDAQIHNVVYALVDATLWQHYGLAPGESFTLSMNGANTAQVTFVALAEVQNLPGTYNTPLDSESDIGLLVDYQSYATVYTRKSGLPLPPNTLWLRTSDDPTALADLRTLWPDAQDRRALTVLNQEESTHVDSIGVLSIGVGTALLLALIGTLLSSWLHTFQRLTSFALLRALGMAPREIAALLLWEQGCIYVLALGLGVVLAMVLMVFVEPAVTLLDLSGPGALANPYDVPQVQVVVPYLQIGLLLLIISLICLCALVLMARVASRPGINQRLRLNED